MSLDSYETLLKFVEMEVNILEHIPHFLADIAHQYPNNSPIVIDPNIEPRKTDKTVRYCNHRADHGYTYQTDALAVFPPACSCFDSSPHSACDGEITVVRGLEWTPRGYRNFLQVHGDDDYGELTVYPKAKIDVAYKPVTGSDGEYEVASSFSTYDIDDKEGFFELQTEGDADSYLEQVGIVHLPQYFQLRSFGPNTFTTENYNTLKTHFRIDYIRVFRPENGYADMEPVYQ